ncbi:MAG: hypothetical protein WCB27_19180 [Thermoguttaceae bacterium]
MTTLPTVEQLERLPLRAIAVYATRAARRARRVLHGVISDETIDSALTIAESVASADSFTFAQSTSASLAASRVAGEAAAIRTKSREIDYAVLCLLTSTRTASSVMLSVLRSNRLAYYLHYAARAAEQAASCAVGALSSKTFPCVCDAIVQDYEKSLSIFDTHGAVTVGKPIDTSMILPPLESLAEKGSELFYGSRNELSEEKSF